MAQGANTHRTEDIREHERRAFPEVSPRHADALRESSSRLNKAIETTRPTGRWWVYGLLALPVLAATGVRVAPLLEGGERLQWQCVSEDGYLMLTVARNVALGNGLSVSAGTVPTNGVQPLATFIYALAFALTGGDRLSGLYPVVATQVLLSIITALLLYRFVKRLFYRGPQPDLVALISACLWYASPTSVMHTQNSLETGLYALMVLSSAACYDAVKTGLRAALNLPQCTLLGAVLGLAFLARNDACFLIGALLVVHLAVAYRNRALQRALIQAFAIGATSVLVALPWLWFNLARFGHLVPVSGRSEALYVRFGQNLSASFVALLEDALLVFRIPSDLQDDGYVIAMSVGLFAAALFAACAKRRWLAARFSAGVGVLACFTGMLFVYYSLFFGMACFLGRYFFPSVALFALLFAAAAPSLATGWTTARAKVLMRGAAGFAVFACIGLNARIYARGREHLHKQVVEWVAANVPSDTWVAATQTGTLGYYHDRTINLDGKVDPDALAARAENRIHEYALARNVEYIVDWAGHAEWARRPEFAAHYELMVHDRQRNLAVLRRRRADRTADPL
jgi:hypothetical protein